MNSSENNHPKRILIVSDEGFAAGGIGTSTANLAVALAQAGQDVVLVWPDAERVQLAGVRQVAVNAKRFDVGKLGFVMLALPPSQEAMPSNWVPEIVHIMRPTYLGIWAYRLAKRVRAKTVLSMHEIVEQLPDSTLIGRILRAVARWWFGTTYNAVDITITPGKFVVNHAYRTLGLKSKPFYLTNGLDIASWRKGFSSVTQTSSDLGRVRICSVINLSPYKNPAMMLEICRVLLERGVQLELKIAGGGVLMPDLQAKILELGLSAHVQLLGQLGRAEVAALVGSSDAFLLTSTFEVQGIVLIEAKALGTPGFVVKAPLSGAVDLIEDGVTGVLFDLDVQKAADTLEPYLRDPGRLRAMRAATYADAAQYDLEPVARAALEIYNDLRAPEV